MTMLRMLILMRSLPELVSRVRNCPGTRVGVSTDLVGLSLYAEKFRGLELD